MKWISKGKKKTYSIKRLFESFICAGRGVISAFKTEQNLLIDLICGVLAIVLGFLLKISTIEFTIILITIALVISMEIMNTTIEYVVDMAMPEIHPLAKLSKDISAGAVLVSAIIASIVGLIIYLPKVIVLFR